MSIRKNRLKNSLKNVHYAGKWYKNADLVYAHSTLATQCNQGTVEEQKSIFDSGSTHTDSPDKPFRPEVGSNRGKARIHQTQEKPQQEPCNRTNGPLLMGVGFLKNKKQFVLNCLVHDKNYNDLNIN